MPTVRSFFSLMTSVVDGEFAPKIEVTYIKGTAVPGDPEAPAIVSIETIDMWPSTLGHIVARIQADPVLRGKLKTEATRNALVQQIRQHIEGFLGRAAPADVQKPPPYQQLEIDGKVVLTQEEDKMMQQIVELLIFIDERPKP